uniref:Uncharacterized protein n=1 Tax=Panagrolaimus sp. JU765 TaxID=591449 RepID=A0AC34R164_9BILA
MEAQSDSPGENHSNKTIQILTEKIIKLENLLKIKEKELKESETKNEELEKSWKTKESEFIQNLKKANRKIDELQKELKRKQNSAGQTKMDDTLLQLKESLETEEDQHFQELQLAKIKIKNLENELTKKEMEILQLREITNEKITNLEESLKGMEYHVCIHCGKNAGCFSSSFMPDL